MTTPNGGIPEGGRSYEQMAELVTIQPPAQANPDLWQNAESARNSFFGNILSGFASIGMAIGSALVDLASSLLGTYTGPNGPLIEIQDGQNELRNRVDLVADISGYCAVYQDRNYQVGGAQKTKLPFNSRIGPKKNAHEEDGGIVLDAPGTWRIDAFFTTNFGTIVGGGGSQVMQIRVYAPGTGGSDTPYSVSHYSFTLDSVRLGHAWPHTVVVAEPGYRVELWWDKTGAGTWNILGGTHQSRLSVNRWDISTGDYQEDTNVPTEDIGTPQP